MTMNIKYNASLYKPLMVISADPSISGVRMHSTRPESCRVACLRVRMYAWGWPGPGGGWWYRVYRDPRPYSNAALLWKNNTCNNILNSSLTIAGPIFPHYLKR